MTPRKEKMGGPATVSLVLHGALVALVIFPMGFRNTDDKPLFGGDGTGGQSVQVSLKSSIPLPAAPENPLATDSNSENLPEPVKKAKEAEPPPPPPKANDYLMKNDKKSRQLRQDEAKKELLAELAKDMHRQSNAVPGTGGRAGGANYGAAPSAGSGGIGFGGDFGTRYTAYVRSVQACLTNQWQQSRPSESVATNSAKAYVTFEILKDGTIVNEHISRTSGFPSEDKDAIATVVGCSGRNGGVHLPALPHDFEAGRIPVEVWFATKQ
jgi:membrane protein involved in colicin uptake